MKTTRNNFEFISWHDGRMFRRRKVKRSPAQNFMLWFAVIITIASISTYLALLLV